MNDVAAPNEIVTMVRVIEYAGREGGIDRFRTKEASHVRQNAG
ncbi:hypothetical protein NQU17_02635 [Clostridiaceae bacterium HFYG-1003]|nr:hypothetical protein NQU17_02635 [Clostridiaceae bacterium HFYG-1003]